MVAGIRCDSAGGALLVRVLSDSSLAHKAPWQWPRLAQIGGLAPGAEVLTAWGVGVFTGCGVVCFGLSGVGFLSGVVLAWQGFGGVMWVTVGFSWFVARFYGMRLRGDCCFVAVLL